MTAGAARVLLFGGSGQVGSALHARLGSGNGFMAPTSTEVSLADPRLVSAHVADCRPTVVINAAAFTNVDEAESQRDLAFTINAAAPEAMATACRAIGARFLHLSSDYVFDGTGRIPYRTDAPAHALNAYGASKRAGEERVLAANPSATVIRTAWVHSGSGKNFIGTAVRLLSHGQPMRVVDDQVGTPTRADTLAYAIVRLLDRPGVAGLQHVTDSGVASWYDVACCVLETLQLAGRAPDTAMVSPAESSEFVRAAVRPNLSILDTHATRRALDWTPPHWRSGVIASTQEWLSSRVFS